ncbi:MAG TPA: indole-3-glycerol phosphate synthase TrpC [Gaiellaceae bacterium]|nr:indole-3-glycerol phosphate synthase TrpC [Gaiellaceae bacterium]
MSFADAFGEFGAIAEFKRRSPSAGALRPGGDPAEVARAYEAAGARAMSVLVDARFDGTWDDLRAARDATSLPLLAKGFFTTSEQLRTAREAGADAVLLLLRDLDDKTCRELMREGDALVEAHDAAEVQRAIALDAPIVGINARDLSTFDVNRDAQLELVRTVTGRIVVAESGIAAREDVLEARAAGASAVLIGSILMRADDPGAKLKELIA